MSGSQPSSARDDYPLVTCIIIFLNEEDYLAEAIESVLAQTYRNWELILVDDGSSDRSSEISRHYVGLDPSRIGFLQHPGGANLGMSASRNLGIENARGGYLAFLDGDDCWYPEKLELQVQLFRDHPDAEMVCGATLYWHSWDKENVDEDLVVHTGDVLRPEAENPRLAQDRLYRAGELVHNLYPLGRGATPSASGYMIKRSLAERVDGFEDSFRGLFEDQVFRAKAFLAADVYVSSQIFDRYRQHEASEVHAAASGDRLMQARREFFTWYGSYARQNYASDRRLLKAIERARRNYFGWRAKARKIRQLIESR